MSKEKVGAKDEPSENIKQSKKFLYMTFRNQIIQIAMGMLLITFCILAFWNLFIVKFNLPSMPFVAALGLSYLILQLMASIRGGRVR